MGPLLPRNKGVDFLLEKIDRSFLTLGFGAGSMELVNGG